MSKPLPDGLKVVSVVVDKDGKLRVVYDT